MRCTLGPEPAGLEVGQHCVGRRSYVDGHGLVRPDRCQGAPCILFVRLLAVREADGDEFGFIAVFP